jgi:HEAT repeat protein
VSFGTAFLIGGVALGAACVSAVAVIVIAKVRRGRAGATTRAMIASYRGALVAVASGEDEDGQALASLCAVPAHIWVRLRPHAVAFLPKVRGGPAEGLGELMRAHGDVDEATRMLISRSAVRRARAAYLLGLVRDPDGAIRLLPLLDDSDADVRMVAARALGTIGDPSAARGILRALSPHHHRIGLPAWVAAEALLAMGAEIGPALQIGLRSEDPAIRNVSAVVAGHSGYLSAAPRLRKLLATDSDREVRNNAAVALGRVGGAEDVPALARHVDPSEKVALRRTCVSALGELGRRESLEILAGLLADDDRRLAELAAGSLVRMGSEGIARLREATRWQGPGARAAGGALELAELRGQLASPGPS